MSNPMLVGRRRVPLSHPDKALFADPRVDTETQMELMRSVD